MFDQPEEWIVAFLGVLWLIITFFAAQYLVGENNVFVFRIVALSALFVVLGFLTWHHHFWLKTYPLFFGFLVFSWLPLLDSYASQASSNQSTWYASWSVKLILTLLPIALGYALKYRRQKQRRLAGEI